MKWSEEWVLVISELKIVVVIILNVLFHISLILVIPVHYPTFNCNKLSKKITKVALIMSKHWLIKSRPEEGTIPYLYSKLFDIPNAVFEYLSICSPPSKPCPAGWVHCPGPPLYHTVSDHSWPPQPRDPWWWCLGSPRVFSGWLGSQEHPRALPSLHPLHIDTRSLQTDTGQTWRPLRMRVTRDLAITPHVTCLGSGMIKK